MHNIKLHFHAFIYVFLAGTIPTLIVYYLFFLLLALIEKNELLTQVVAISTLLSPIIGPIAGSLLLCRFAKKMYLNLWKHILLDSILVIALFESYFIIFEPYWIGVGTIVGFFNGVTLAIIAFVKQKRQLVNINETYIK